MCFSLSFFVCGVADGLTFYKCPIAEACLPGGNGSRAECATGYAGIACRYATSVRVAVAVAVAVTVAVGVRSPGMMKEELLHLC